MAVKRLIISGQVQGVGYRYSLVYAARNFGVDGWVRNRRDGTVEAMVQGTPEAVESFIEWAKKGPELARVENVEVVEGSGSYSGFSIQDTV